MHDKPHVDRALLVELHAHDATQYLRLFQFLALFLASSALSIFAHHALSSAWWVWLLCMPLYLLSAASLHGVSLFTHEAVHGVLAPNQTINRVLGALCAWPVLQNCSAYRVLHLQHHAHTGVVGDPDHFKNYTPRSALVFLMHWGRLILGYPAYVTAIPILGFYHGRGKDRLGILAELFGVAALITAVLVSPIPGDWLIHAWLIPMLFINTMVNIRGMSQHTLLEHEQDIIRGTRTILTNRVTQWFMCNENFHLEHHLYPGVPWYNLPELHDVIEDELRERGAPFVSSYGEFTLDFIWATFTTSDRRTVAISKLSD